MGAYWLASASTWSSTFRVSFLFNNHLLWLISTFLCFKLNLYMFFLHLISIYYPLIYRICPLTYKITCKLIYLRSQELSQVLITM